MDGRLKIPPPNPHPQEADGPTSSLAHRMCRRHHGLWRVWPLSTSWWRRTWATLGSSMSQNHALGPRQPLPRRVAVQPFGASTLCTGIRHPTFHAGDGPHHYERLRHRAWRLRRRLPPQWPRLRAAHLDRIRGRLRLRVLRRLRQPAHHDALSNAESLLHECQCARERRNHRRPSVAFVRFFFKF